MKRAPDNFPIRRCPWPFLIAIIGTVATACTSSRLTDLNGKYAGFDGSNTLPSRVEWTLATTGDGLISGIWKSSGEVTQAQLSGKLGTFGTELILHVTSGACTGDFTGDLHEKDDQLTGKLRGNPKCPDRVYSFDLKKSR